jgi:hypothetical protein
MEVQLMDLSAREKQVLRSIEGGLAESDPGLVAKLAKLSRLMPDADMPAAGRGRAGSRVGGRARRYSRLGPAMLALWLAMTCALIATAVALSHGSAHRACTGLVAVQCASRSPAGHVVPGARG